MELRDKMHVGLTGDSKLVGMDVWVHDCLSPSVSCGSGPSAYVSSDWLQASFDPSKDNMGIANGQMDRLIVQVTQHDTFSTLSHQSATCICSYSLTNIYSKLNGCTVMAQDV